MRLRRKPRFLCKCPLDSSSQVIVSHSIRPVPYESKDYLTILHIISSLNPVGGGPAEAVLQISRTMIQEGHRVEVVCLDSPADAWLANYPMVVHPLGSSISSYGYCRALMPWLKAHGREFDGVVVHGIWQYAGFATRRVMRRLNKPYVVYTHGMLDPWFKTTYPLKHLKKSVYWPLGEFRVLKDAAAVLFTCEEERILARQSFKMYRATERVVSFGTSEPEGDAQEQKSQFSKAFPDLAELPFLLYLGRIHPKKGVDLLIHGFAKNAAANPSLRLMVAGPLHSEWAMELKGLSERLGIADRLIWPGMLMGDLKWGAFRSCQALILPSHQENFGIVVAEALACGKPVLISNKVNIWREVERAGAGLVEDDTIEGAHNLISRWTQMPPDQKSAMSGKARTCFVEQFEIHAATASLVQLLEEFSHPKK